MSTEGAELWREGHDKRKREFADANRKRILGEFSTSLGNIQKTIAGGINPETQQPLSEQEKSDLQHAHQVTSDYVNNLYNPNFDPAKGSVNEHPIHKLLDKLGVTKPPAKLPAEQMQDLQGIQAKYAQTPEENPYLKNARQLKQVPGISQEDINKSTRHIAGVPDEKPEGQNWVPTNVKFADGSEATLQRNSKDGTWTDLAGNPVPSERLATATVAPKPPTGKPRTAWSRDKSGKIYSVQLDANNQPVKGSENYEILPPAYMTGRISTGNYHFTDEQGNVHQVQETRTSSPAFQGGSAGSAGATPTPKKPGEQRKDIGEIQAKHAGSSKDKVIGFKGSKDYVETKRDYQAAIDRTKTMDQNLVNAKNGDQQAMLSLVANHIGMTLGAQRGARITRAVWDEAVSSTPWLEKIKAKFDDRGYLSGVTLAPEQMDQMVRLAHEKTETLKEHIGRLDAERKGESGDGGGAKKYKQTATGPNGHKIGSDDGTNWFDVQTGKPVK